MHGILFFGTPHEGSEETGLGTIEPNTLNVLPVSSVNLLEKKTKLPQIVIQNSAVLTLPANQQTQIASMADHSELVKFCNDQDPGYKQGLAQLCDMRKKALLTARGFRQG